MWCDNCLLVFPLRAGAMALATLITLYSIAGGIVLFMYGEFLWFMYPEVQIYGGISMAVGALSLFPPRRILTFFPLALPVLTRLLFFVMPFVLLISAIRAGIMIFRLDYYQSNVIWECNHGGQLYNATLANSTTYDPSTYTGDTLPSGFCGSGFHSLYLAFAFALCIDVALQLYQYFLVWRFKARLEQYFSFKMAGAAGLYTA
ncbi:hypothetical protein JCM11251_000631 [Rhodosporidiobolus azoricus]